jgi:hypothetical protein
MAGRPHKSLFGKGVYAGGGRKSPGTDVGLSDDVQNAPRKPAAGIRKE